MHVPELTDALHASLERNARSVLRSYLAGGCPADLQVPNGSGNRVALAAADGTLLCGDLGVRGIPSLTSATTHTGEVIVSSYSNFQIIAFPLNADNSKSYIFLLLNHYKSPFQIYGMLPGNITFEVSLVVTVVMAILVALPIKRLRAMAHQIGVGNLDARVSNGLLSRYVRFLGAGDDLDGLAIDFNSMAGRIEALVNAQRLLLRDVSHELRSPLARVNLALELARTESNPSADDYLDRIEAETGKLNDLISQLIDLSNMEMISGLAHPEEIELSLIVLDLLPDMQFEAAAKNCRVTAAVTQDCRARGDRNLLHRALENVARNAIRYTPPGGLVAIELSTDEKNGARQAVLKVTDSGPGVPEGELRAILTPFYRVDKSRDSASGGFGIGLAIADRTIQLHNGELRVCNSSSGGLIVEMRSPALPIQM